MSCVNSSHASSPGVVMPRSWLTSWPAVSLRGEEAPDRGSAIVCQDLPMISRIAIVPVVLFVGVAGFALGWNGWVVGTIGLFFGVAAVGGDSLVERSRRRQVGKASDAPRLGAR